MATATPSKKLYVGNLDFKLQEIQLIKLFQKFGKVVHLDYIWHKDGPSRGKPKGYCFVEYSSLEEARLAIEKMDGKLALSRRLRVNYATQDTEKGKVENPQSQIQSEKTAEDLVRSSATMRKVRIAQIEMKLSEYGKKDPSNKPNISTTAQSNKPDISSASALSETRTGSQSDSLKDTERHADKKHHSDRASNESEQKRVRKN